MADGLLRLARFRWLPGSYWVAVFVIILCYCVLAHLVKNWLERRWGL